MIFINPDSIRISETRVSALESLTAELCEKEPNRYDLRVTTVGSLEDVLSNGVSLVIVALVGSDLHIRIFDADGARVIDKSENDLKNGSFIERLKRIVAGGGNGLSEKKKLKIIKDATSAAAHTDLEDRDAFIERKRDVSWAHPDVLRALRAPVGNKCWYSEVHLDGEDPNVDHFCPKGSVREVNESLEPTGKESVGYWWLAFEPRNYRLACMHSNQRRVDTDTDGGKWDFFPTRKKRAPELTSWEQIEALEDPLPLDPCSRTDTRLLCFDPDGNPCASDNATDTDKKRVDASIWLFHLKKKEIRERRRDYVQDIQKDIRKANTEFQLWARGTPAVSLEAKGRFDSKIAEIDLKIASNAVFSGAKRSAVRLAMSKYEWVAEFLTI